MQKNREYFTISDKIYDAKMNHTLENAKHHTPEGCVPPLDE